MPTLFRSTRRVEFGDTDMAGLVHFPRFFYYMEECEHAFLRSIGAGVVMRDAEGTISWPRVSVTCEYQRPARLDDELVIELRVVSKGRSSIRYRFDFLLGGQAIAVGQITAVCCRIPADGPPRSMPIPEWIASAIEVDPALE